MAAEAGHRVRVRETLLAYSTWVARNADDLAGAVAPGSLGWSLTISCGADEVPEISVSAKRFDGGVVDAFLGMEQQ